MFFAHPDKNLEPTAVIITRYIQDALVHLKDHSTYWFIYAGGGLKRDEALRSEIFKWTVAFREEVGDDTVVEPSAFSTSFTNFARIQLK